MATNYPAGLDNLTNPVTTDPVNSPSHAVQHANANDAIEALQAKVGTDNSLVTTSIDYRVRQLEANPVGTANKITQLVINNTGSTLAKGKVVYASGSVGASGQLRVSLSSNAAESTSSKTFGVLAEQIIQGGQGTVVCEGLLENIDTTGANDGDPIWLGTNGSMIFGLANKPVAPAHLVFVGIVVRGGNANNGSIFVKVQNGFELDELHTVLLSSLADKDLLTYDSATGLWKNKTFTTLDIPTKTYVDTALSNLSNTVTTDYVPVADVGQPDGVASLDSTGKIPLAQMGNLVAGAPTALDTLNELATALGNNPNYATDITTALGTKVSKNGGDTITVSSASTKGLAIRSVASQTANLQEWQNQYGSVIAKIDNEAIFNSLNAGSGPDSYSSIVIGNRWIRNEQRSALTRFGVNTGEWHMASNPDNSVIAITDNQVGVFGVSATLPTFTVKAAASQTANLTEWQNSNGSIIARIDSGGIRWGNSTLSSAYGQLFLRDATDYGGAANINTGYAGTKGVVIRGYASQTANLQEWQISDGTAIAYLTTVSSNNNSAHLYIGGGADWKIGSNELYFGRSGGNSYITHPTNFTISTSYGGSVIVKGSASQTANLQEWQNSAGTALSYITKDGTLDLRNTSATAFTFTNSGNVGPKIDLWGGQYGIGIAVGRMSFFTPASGGIALKQDSYSGTSVFDVAYNGATSIGLQSASAIGLVIKAAASQTADLQQWQNSAGTVLASINSSGNLILGNQYISNSSASAYGRLQPLDGGTNQTIIYPASAGLLITNAGVTGMVIVKVRGTSGQTGNLQEWQNSAGTVLAKIAADGQLSVGSGTSNYLSTYDAYGNITSRTAGTNYGANISVFTGATSYIGMVIRGQSGQTANLQEWQNNSGTVLAKITSTGAFDATAITVNGSPISGGGLTPFSISSNTGLSSNSKYFVNTSAARTLTLPASPSVGDEIQVFDASNLAGTNNVTISSNGGKINGSVQDAIVDVNGGAMVLIYTGSTYGWRAG